MSNMDRRSWLKAGAIFTGSLAFLSAPVSRLSAMPTAAPTPPVPVMPRITDADIAHTAPGDLKARLFFNENPFGPSEKAKQAIQASIANSYQYGFREIQGLVGKIAAYEGVGAAQILLAAGSSPLLLAAAVHYCKAGDSVISGETTYDALPGYAEKLGAKWVKVPMTADHKLDLDAMEKAIDTTTKLIYICNPNNPTATVVDNAKLKAFCERVSKKVMVFVDEAYIDYLPDPQSVTLIDSVKKGQNIIVARTFSKLYGFAGLRVGYIISQPETIKTLNPYTDGPYSISAPSLHAALAAYQDQEFLQDALKKTLASRDFLYKTLKAESYEYIPSSANFVMFPIKMDGKRFVSEMMKRGVGVRNWTMQGKEWCRVSIGRMDEMEAFATAFKELS